MSEARFRALSEHASDIVAILDTTGTLRYASPSHARVLGYRPDDIVGTPVLAYAHPDDRERARAAVMGCLETPGGTSRVEARLRHVDGSWVPLETIADNRTADPAIGGIVVTSRDITVRKATEQVLQEDAARLAHIVATQDAVAAADLDVTAIMPLITDRARNLTGADGAVVELIDGDALVYRAANGTMAAYLGVRLPLDGTLSGLSIRTGETLHCVNGQEDPRTDPALCRRLRIGSMVAVPLRYGGHAVGVLKVVATASHAFDERTVQTLELMAGVLGSAMGQAEAFSALRASEHRLRTVVTHAPLILFALDRHGVYTLSEGAALQALGREPGSAVGRSVFDLYRDYPDLIQQTRRALAGETTALTSHFGDAVFENWLVPVLDNQGAVDGVIGVSSDVTDRVRAEEALTQRNAELQQFAYVASHDLQEPLRTISSYLQLLSRSYKGRLDDDADEFIGYAVDGAKRMSALIQGVLEYARVGATARDAEAVDLGALVSGVVATLHAMIEDKGATVTIGPLPTLDGDAIQLGQLFQNLIGNALKFCTDAPAVSITAETQRGAWLLRVRDNGIGIAPEYAERVFAMFQRLHTRTEYEGTGIGLSVCKKIVETHGGRIWVESEVGVGTTFCVTLPTRTAVSVPA